MCYETALRKSPKLAGRVVLDFKIDKSGAVKSASVATDASDLQDLGACVVKGLSAISFPPPNNAEEVKVEYPIIFNPGD